jgi:hypothetical protein
MPKRVSCTCCASPRGGPLTWAHLRPCFHPLLVQKSQVSHDKDLPDFLGLPLCESYVCRVSKTIARRHTYRREKQRCGSVHCRTNSSSVAVVVHRACCSVYPFSAKPTAMEGTPFPGSPEKRAFSWCPLAPRFSPGLDHEKTRAIINARLRGQLELF